MRVMFVLIILSAGTVLSYPFWQASFPQVQQVVDGLLAKKSPQTTSAEEFTSRNIMPVAEPAVVPTKKVVYQWKDDDGQLKFTESPPPDGRDYKEKVLKSEEPTQLSHSEKEQRVDDYKKAQKSYRSSSHYASKSSGKSRGASSSRSDRCRSLNKKIKDREQRLSSRTYRGGTYDKKNNELRDLKYKKIKDC